MLEGDALLDGSAGFGELEAGHDHAGDPEENDVRAGGEGGGRIEVGKAGLGLRLGVGPAEGCEGPEPGAGPGVEHVVLLYPVFGVGGTGEGNVDFGRVAQVGLGEFLAVHALGIPDGNAMTPPELTGDAPVLDVFQPVEIHLRPALGVHLDKTVAHDGLGLLDARVA